VTVSLKILNPGIDATPKSMDIAILTREIDSELSGRIPYVVPKSAAASGAGHAALPPDVAVLEGYGPSGSGMHSKDEFVEIDSIPLGLHQVTRLLIELDGRNGH
jgi:acetylornithine deacetylase/succinyl-diaminopimelate desuccinylase-like protein